MTRAALLPLLNFPGALPATAVPDLEQLALAFPYCQTAHLLLAKAAHDQGNMLAGQRLRRAATYAADRQLLRQLLEQPARFANAAASLAPPVEAGPTASEPAPAPPATALPEVSPASALTAAEDAKPASGFELAGEATPVEAAEKEPAEIEAAEAFASGGEARGEAAEIAVVDQPAPLVRLPADELPAASAPGEQLPAPGVGASAAVAPAQAALAQEPAAETPALDAADEAAGVEAPQETAVVPAPLEEPPVAPPPIRPSAEKGTARFEFGLSPALETEFTAYQLPEFSAEEVAPAELVFLGAAFAGAPGLAYALGAGSRLGYSLQMVSPGANSATAAADVAENISWDAPASETPGSPLPPAGAFFEPDALLLEHLANPPAPAAPVPSSLDLIDSFLRRTPPRRRGIVSLITVAEQPDLSVRSTQAEPDLASESLARILAGQGKTERAIAVYERLMMRQPEKSAYFAVQIDLLRNPPAPSS